MLIIRLLQVASRNPCLQEAGSEPASTRKGLAPPSTHSWTARLILDSCRSNRLYPTDKRARAGPVAGCATSFQGCAVKMGMEPNSKGQHASWLPKLRSIPHTNSTS